MLRQMQSPAIRLSITCCMQALGASEQDALLRDVEIVALLDERFCK
jgi:hypothetical protein